MLQEEEDLEVKNAGREMALCIYETTLIAHAKSDGLLQSYTSIAESGASSHMVYDETMLVNVKPHDIMVTFGNDFKLRVLSKGTYHGHTIDDNGEKVNIRLQDVLYVPELTVNLFSVTIAVSQPGVFFMGSDQAFQLKTETQSFPFDKQLKNGSGKLYAEFYTQIINMLEEKSFWNSPLCLSKSIFVYWDMQTKAQSWILQPITTLY
jgi:hypothetical protein